MSVDYNCGIVLGWKVSQEERDRMVEQSDYEYEDDFICVDCYRDDSDYITEFGCIGVLVMVFALK